MVSIIIWFLSAFFLTAAVEWQDKVDCFQEVSLSLLCGHYTEVMLGCCDDLIVQTALLKATMVIDSCKLTWMAAHLLVLLVILVIVELSWRK